MADTILQGEKITKIFHQGKAEAKILDGIDIKIYEKDFTVIMGPSGAGKSTLLYSLSGMDQINGGHVLYRGREISSLSEKQMARLWAEEFGFVFQQTHLVSNLTLLENVLVAGYYEDPFMGSSMIGMKGFLISEKTYEEIGVGLEPTRSCDHSF